MTIASELTKLQTNLTNAYASCNNKGATMPSSQNFDNLANTIDSIETGGGGITPTGTIEITENGTYDVTNYATAEVTVDGSGGGGTVFGLGIENIFGGVDSYGVLQRGTANIGDINFTGVKSITNEVLQYKFFKYTALTGAVRFPDLESISSSAAVTRAFQGTSISEFYAPKLKTLAMSSLSYSCAGCKSLHSVNLESLTDLTSGSEFTYTFSNCSNLTSINLSALRTINGSGSCSYMFTQCSSLESISLPSLVTIADNSDCSYMFNQCTALKTISLPSLTTVSGSKGCMSMFSACKAIVTVSFPALTTISGSQGLDAMFGGCTSLTTLSFPLLSSMSVATACQKLLSGCTALTDVYFNSLTTSSFGSVKTQFTNMLQNTGSNVTHTLHFPSNLESTISGLTGYPNFGGTSGYVVLAFDLPETS